MSNFLKYFNLRAAYRAVFRKPDPPVKQVVIVMDHLKHFCRADESCVVFGKDGRVDTHATAVAEGRRETYLEIMRVLNLSDETLDKLKDEPHD